MSEEHVLRVKEKKTLDVYLYTICLYEADIPFMLGSWDKVSKYIQPNVLIPIYAVGPQGERGPIPTLTH